MRILVTPGTENVIRGNMVRNGGSIYLQNAHYNTVELNTVCNGGGIYVSSAHSNTLLYNAVSGCPCGFSIGGAAENLVAFNTLRDNVCGIYLRHETATDNVIYNNNFIDNASHTRVDSGTGPNVFNLDRPIGGNYWSGWTSPDVDGDGFVDDPYVFAGGQDNLPLVRPWSPTIHVGIDVKPGSYPNAVNLGSHGVVPVAILSTSDFDATRVDPETIQLAGAGVAVRGNSGKYSAHQEDVNNDGLVDQLVQVETENFDPRCIQDGHAVLTGALFEAFGGRPIEGADEITIVPPAP